MEPQTEILKAITEIKNSVHAVSTQQNDRLESLQRQYDALDVKSQAGNIVGNYTAPPGFVRTSEVARRLPAPVARPSRQRDFDLER